MVNRSDFNSQEFLTLEACSPGAKSLPEILASPILLKLFYNAINAVMAFMYTEPGMCSARPTVGPHIA